MTRLVTTPKFRFDINDILNFLEEVAGARVAARYSGRFDETIVRLTNFPESGAPRPALGVSAPLGRAAAKACWRGGTAMVHTYGLAALTRGVAALN